MYGTHALLHTSVILFFWAIGEFFNAVNHIFGLVVRYSLVVSAIIYVLLSISPLFFSNSPCNMPMTPLLHAAFVILRIIFRLPWWCPRWLRGEPFDLTGLQYYKGIHFDTAHLFSIEAEKRAEKLEPHAMDRQGQRVSSITTSLSTLSCVSTIQTLTQSNKEVPPLSPPVFRP